MNAPRFCLPLVLMTALAAAQTTGVPGTNDLRVDFLGSGTTSCVPMILCVGDEHVVSVHGVPASPVLAAVASFCVPGALVIDGTYSLDLDLLSMTVLFDGAGLILPPNPITPLLQTNASGVFIVGGVVNLPTTLGMQWALFNPTFPLGLATTQAYDLLLDACSICPNTIGGDLSPLSDDGDVALVLGSPFTFYGTVNSTLFVNMNGNLTFLAPDSDFTPTEAEMLSGVPRIAPAWYDFVPDDLFQGTVRAFDDGTVLQVEWFNVRSFGPACSGGLDSNTFCVDLDFALGEISFGYAEMNLCAQGSGPGSNLIVGISPGGGLSVANPVDLSLGGNAGALNLAVYEEFPLGITDLATLTSFAGQRVVFTPAPAGGYDQNVL